jgi:hypothetical protein
MQLFKILTFLILPILTFAQTETASFNYYIQTEGDDQLFRDSGTVAFDSSSYVVQLPTEQISVNVFKTGKNHEGDLILFGYCGDRLRVIRYPDGSVSGFFLWSKYRIFYLNVKKV